MVFALKELAVIQSSARGVSSGSTGQNTLSSLANELRLSLGSDAVDALELLGVYIYRLMRGYMQMVSHWSLLTHSAIWGILSVLEVVANQRQSPELGLHGVSTEIYNPSLVAKMLH